MVDASMPHKKTKRCKQSGDYGLTTKYQSVPIDDLILGLK
ncbi:hypothetical protein FTN78_p100009 (plasmid) [Lactococcus lactis subsp. lactis bv. diacetylactis]|nr:hypothetical protein FTN78_p100009 [Lactococcus lactis subsp. lactis bv. diacetylactis]